ncbi:MAG: imidazoleglycerol-phosphate dehydratase HisB [Oscillospiraceae bacterium]|nr:imidazoleglycerol-phosphate dehydratase HisB [Oscillospiraceae bacterium]
MGRNSQLSRKTKETNVEVFLSLDGGDIQISTGIGFFDHMLHSLAFHAGWGLAVKTDGDLHVDGHHAVEDSGIVLGQAFSEAIGDKQGIERFGHAYVPMDEALGFAAVDISGRAYMSFESPAEIGKLGDYDACLTREFFRAFVTNAKLSLHINATGRNHHHVTEALYKSAGRALRVSCALTGQDTASTKGVL